MKESIGRWIWNASKKNRRAPSPKVVMFSEPIGLQGQSCFQEPKREVNQSTQTVSHWFATRLPEGSHQGSLLEKGEPLTFWKQLRKPHTAGIIYAILLPYKKQTLPCWGEYQWGLVDCLLPFRQPTWNQHGDCSPTVLLTKRHPCSSKLFSILVLSRMRSSPKLWNSLGCCVVQWFPY